jgi:hypothetical protein
MIDVGEKIDNWMGMSDMNKRVKLTDEEKRLKRNELSKLYRQKHPEKAAEYTRKWMEKNPEKLKENAERWRKNNPEKAAQNQKVAQKKTRLKKMNTGDWVKNELIKLAWLKENEEEPRYPRRIANWAGGAIDRIDCDELSRCLVDRQLVMRSRRDRVELFSVTKCGRGDKPVDVVIVGWNGWMTNPRGLDKLLTEFGMGKVDWDGLDWTVPDYWLAKPLRNVLGHDLTRIRLGDKWKGWRINQKELHYWLIEKKCRLETFVDDASWGFELVSEDVSVRRFSVIWSGIEVSRDDLNGVVEWVRTLME